MIDCFFSCRDNIIIVTNKTATPNNKPTETSNKPAITNITKDTAIRIRITIVATNGDDFPDYPSIKLQTQPNDSFYHNSPQEWSNKQNSQESGKQLPPDSGICSKSNGTRKRKANATTAMLTME